MPDIVWIVLIVIALAICFIEWRIMRKPASARSAREASFLAADRTAAKQYRRASLHVLPLLGSVMSVLLIGLSIPFWFGEHRTLGISLTVLGAVGVVGMLLLWRFIRSSRGQAWEAKQDAAVSSADENGQPRWFTSARGGIALGTFFFIAGAALLVVAATTRNGSGTGYSLPGILMFIGALALVAAFAQRRAEHHS